MDKDTNVFGPVIMEEDTPGLEFDTEPYIVPTNPRASDDSHGNLD